MKSDCVKNKDVRRNFKTALKKYISSIDWNRKHKESVMEVICSSIKIWTEIAREHQVKHNQRGYVDFVFSCLYCIEPDMNSLFSELLVQLYNLFLSEPETLNPRNSSFISTLCFLTYSPYSFQTVYNSIFISARYIIFTKINETKNMKPFDAIYQELEFWLHESFSCWINYLSHSLTSLGYCENFVEFSPDTISSILCTEYVRVRCEEAFTLALKYPETIPVFEELKICLQKTGLESYFCQKVSSQITEKLLHAASTTSDLLSFFIVAYRVFYPLDETFGLLNESTHSLRDYLKHRTDSCKCVAQLIFHDDASSDLLEQMIPECSSDESEDENKNVTTKKQIVKSDLISALIKIYGNLDDFLKEYQQLLSTKLYQSSDNTVIECEKRHVELLKMRFGSKALVPCSVMINDVVESQRFSADLTTEFKDNIESDSSWIFFSVLIRTPSLWPDVDEVEFQFPQVIRDKMNIATEALQKEKSSRYLEWSCKFGEVTLEIELGDGTEHFISCNPIQASVLLHFQKSHEFISIDNLVESMGINPSNVSLLHTTLMWWNEQGFLKRKNQKEFCLVHSLSEFSDPFELEDESVSAYGKDISVDRISALEPMAYFENNCWPYVEGMLRNIGSMSSERILGSLKIFAVAQGQDTIGNADLEQFLAYKIETGKLKHVDGVYSLNWPV